MIAIRCPDCSKSYKVKTEMAGKKAKCGCGTSIQIPRPKQKRSATAAPQRKKRKPKPEPEADPWDVDVDSYDDEDFGDDYGDGYDDYAPPARRSSGGTAKKGGRSKKGKKNKRSGGTSSVMKTIGLIFAGVAVLGLLLGLAFKPIGAITGGGVIIVCCALSFAGSLRCLIAAFQEDVLCGVLWLFVPFYSLYYIITRFSELAEYIMMWIGGVIGIFVCMGYFTLLGNL